MSFNSTNLYNIGDVWSYSTGDNLSVIEHTGVTYEEWDYWTGCQKIFRNGDRVAATCGDGKALYEVFGIVDSPPGISGGNYIKMKKLAVVSSWVGWALPT